ncbi:hypothetical protein [Metasolibacillus sp.]|uniref:hypothetical protein n=1 Tax=Metasolibacillus sp. TaxID=2703680 RepID=UPI0025F6409F|nr:hypothetical protein [Metasolibacillus sp.]MCT6925364.1 hypothetical protein [Metasolibacillus sp.]MCT6941608.1 hypothetical protein [Metasolibacillus sp.]
MDETLRNSVKAMIKETFEGPPIPVKGSWFTNPEPNSGIFGVLEESTFDEASLLIHGTTLAAHTDHIRYHMWGTNGILNTGKQPKMEWEKSWEIQAVDEEQWAQIQKDLHNEYQVLLQAIDAIEENEVLSNVVIPSLAHSAYHLGAIRQMLKIIKAQ